MLLTFDEQGHEGDDGRGEPAHGDAVGAVVPRRVDQSLQLGKQLARLGRQLLPSEREAGYGHVTQPHDDGKQRVEVLEVPAAVRGSTQSVSLHRHGPSHTISTFTYY